MKAVIFDMDGVIMDSEPLYHEHRLAYAKSKNYPADKWTINTFAGLSYADILEDMRQQMAPDMDFASFKADFENLDQDKFLNYEAALTPSLKPFLKTLQEKNIPACIASAGSKASIEKMLDATALKAAFAGWFSGEDVAHNKPAPDVYLKALAHVGVKPEEAIIIEDSELGISAAKKTGALVLALKSPYGYDQSQADHIIDKLTDATAYL